jgi:glycerate kinase
LKGAGRIVEGIGGSATNDAGAGMASASGWRFGSHAGVARRVVPQDFLSLREVKVPDGYERLPEVIGACAVTNPLFGPREADPSRRQGGHGWVIWLR